MRSIIRAAAAPLAGFAILLSGIPIAAAAAAVVADAGSAVVVTSERPAAVTEIGFDAVAGRRPTTSRDTPTTHASEWPSAGSTRIRSGRRHLDELR